MSNEPERIYAPAARQALTAFGVEPADLHFVRLAENVTFRVTDARDGAALVLRLHRPWYHDIVALRSEHVWTRALAEAGIATPVPLLTAGGESFVQVDIADTGERRWAGLARWVEGEMLADVMAGDNDSARNAGRLGRVGALMAAMHNQATGWTPPAGFRRPRLDADGLMGSEPFWGPFWDQALLSAGERDMLLDRRDRLHRALTAYGRPARTFSLIHADLHPSNVVISGTEASVIDFDDTGFGWHQYDFAAALIAYQDHPDFAELCDGFFAGYRSLRTLSDDDLALLPMFLLIRDMAHLGWYHQRPELPRPDDTVSRLKERVCARAADFEPPL